MKKLFFFLLLLVAGTACQHPSTPAQAAAPTAKPTATARPAQVVAQPAQPASQASLLTPAMLRLLREHDLAALFQTVHSGDSMANNHAQNGFFGPDRYRIELAFSQVLRDTAQPNVLRVVGKSRYKKVITPFVGIVTLTNLTDQPEHSAKEVAEAKKMGYEFNDQPYMYTATGNFELREDSTHRGAGIFRGRVALDWSIDKEGTLSCQSRTQHTLTQGGGLKYEGTWTNSTTHRVYPVVWVENIFTYQGPQVFNHFLVGERDVDFNPKYAKLGWNTYWENDEWWADSPKLSLNL